jgi:hypothetical protein
MSPLSGSLVACECIDACEAPPYLHREHIAIQEMCNVLDNSLRAALRRNRSQSAAFTLTNWPRKKR